MIPDIVAAVLAGGAINPDDYTYGSGAPSPQVPYAVLYIDLLTRLVYSYQSGASMSSAFGSSMDTAPSSWIQVADYSTIVGSAALSAQAGNNPMAYDIDFVRGNEKTWTFFVPGVCYMPVRPQLDGVDIPDPTPDDPLGVNTLTVPWVEKYWLSEVRDTYVSSARYFNGWVPWYGTFPNWVWWDVYSLKAVMQTDASWDNVHKGTLVKVTILTPWSMKIRASRSYYWDLVSASAATKDISNNPTTFAGIKTHVRGHCRVENAWTIAEPQALSTSPGTGQTPGSDVILDGGGDA